MKISKFLALGILAAAGWFSPAAQATVVSASGDLILAFRTNDNSNGFNLEIDLGSYTNFTNVAPGAVLNLNLGGAFYGANGGLAASDLSSVFGVNWNALTALVWSVAGTASPTLLDTFAAGFVPQQKNTAAQQGASNTLNTVRSSINGAPNTFNNGTTTVNLASPTATTLDIGLNGSYSNQIRGGGKTIDYNYFANSTEAAVSNVGSSALTLWRLNAGSGPGTALGVFNLGSNGSFTFTAAPEPGSAVLLAVSALAVLARRRRLSV